METVTYKNIKFQVWDLGGQTTIRLVASLPPVAKAPPHRCLLDLTGGVITPILTPSYMSLTVQIWIDFLFASLN